MGKRGLEWPAVAVTTAAIVVVSWVGVELAAWPPQSSSTAPAAPAPTVTPQSEAPVMAVLGDSYAASETSFAALTAEYLGAEYVDLSQGGTGYLNPGQEDEGEAAYPQRTRKVVQSRPDLVVVQGGVGNDLALSPAVEDVRTAVGDTLGFLADALPPGVKLVVLGQTLDTPLHQDQQMQAAIREMNEVLAEEAARVGARYLDTSGWLEDEHFGADGVHPTPQGHERMADRLTAVILPLVG